MRKITYFFANMPKVSFAVVCVFCTLFFVIPGCERKEEFETFTARFFVRGVNSSFGHSPILSPNFKDRDVWSKSIARPVNLPEEFQIEELHVRVTIRIVDGDWTPYVKIIEIEKLNEEDTFLDTIWRNYFYVQTDTNYACWWLECVSRASINHHTPVNLPEEFQIHNLRARIGIRLQEAGRRECFYRVVKLVDICDIFSSRFTVHKTEELGYLLIENPDIPRIAKPINLPEEYKQNGLSVDITFRQFRSIGMLYENKSVHPIEIISIMETPVESAGTNNQ